MPSSRQVAFVAQGFDKGSHTGSVMGTFGHSIQETSAPSQQWIFDSGATTHVTHDLSSLSPRQHHYAVSQGLAVGNRAPFLLLIQVKDFAYTLCSVWP